MILSRIVALALAALGLAAGVEAVGFGLRGLGTLGAGALPFGAGALLFVTAAAAVVLPNRPSGEEEEEPMAPRRLAGYVAGTGFFALALEPLGALITIALLFLFMLKLVERRSWFSTVAMTAVAVLGTWLVFGRILSVPLPRGLLG